jgi:hypothetical protein
MRAKTFGLEREHIGICFICLRRDKTERQTRTHLRQTDAAALITRAVIDYASRFKGSEPHLHIANTAPALLPKSGWEKEKKRHRGYLKLMAPFLAPFKFSIYPRAPFH